MNTLSSAHPTISSSSGSGKILQRYPLICFYLMAFGISWLAWLPYVLSQGGLGILSVRFPLVALLPGLYLGPILSSFLMTAATAGKPGVRNLLYRLVLWRVSWKWYLFSLIVVPAIMVPAIMVLDALIFMILVTGSLSALQSLPLQAVLSYQLALIFQIVVSGLGEEPGWRGFALPLWQQRCGPVLGRNLAARVVVGMLASAFIPHGLGRSWNELADGVRGHP